MNWTKITSFAHACEDRGYNPADILPDVSKMPEWLGKWATAQIKRAVIAEAINQGKVPDYNDTSYYKYEVWFRINKNDPSGFGLSYYDYGHAFTCAGVGSRLAFFERDAAEHFGKNFLDIHADAIIAAA